MLWSITLTWDIQRGDINLDWYLIFAIVVYERTQSASLSNHTTMHLHVTSRAYKPLVTCTITYCSVSIITPASLLWGLWSLILYNYVDFLQFLQMNLRVHCIVQQAVHHSFYPIIFVHIITLPKARPCMCEYYYQPRLFMIWFSVCRQCSGQWQVDSKLLYSYTISFLHAPQVTCCVCIRVLDATYVYVLV